MKKTYKIKTGKESKRSSWGQIGKSRGIYSGGFTKWAYGVKGIFSIEILECWGDFKNMEL